MARKILFFIADNVPTATETAQIANIVGDVQIRNAKHSTLYGANLEPADGFAGTPPQAYIDAIADYPAGNVTPGQAGYGLTIIPVNPGGIAANGGTRQLYAIRTSLNEATGEVTVTDVTAACAWVSGTPAKGTVGASTGLVTGANSGAGTSLITATYDPDGGSGEAGIVATTTATFV